MQSVIQTVLKSSQRQRLGRYWLWDIAREFETEFTDRQIDQIVYRLYGLTPVEIKLVEECTQR